MLCRHCGIVVAVNDRLMICQYEEFLLQAVLNSSSHDDVNGGFRTVVDCL
jgi:hypothetical protein